MDNHYRAAIDRMLTLADFERKSRAAQPPDWHLRRMEVLLARLGNPHFATPVVHVAGSKGKGSTSAMLASVFQAAGYRTGLYISPHLHAFPERIQVGSAPVSQDVFAGLIDRLWPDVEGIASRGDVGDVSVFELLTAMAFVHFRDVSCDIAVIEVGLGGRLDATNLVRPAVSVITPISLDHVAILGDTVAKIAAEKAGIIKPGAPVVIGRQTADARAVFEATAKEMGSPLTDALAEVLLSGEARPDEGPQHFTVRHRDARYEVELPLLGAHQVDNARTAIAAVGKASEAIPGLTVNEGAVRKGLREVNWPARAEILRAGPPLVLADGAHNDASAAALAATVARHFGGRSPVVYVIGGTIGHDSLAFAQALAGAGGRIIVTQSRHPRAVPAEELAGALRAAGTDVAGTTADVAAGLAAAGVLAGGPRGMIVATGSLFVAAEAGAENVLGLRPELYPDLKGPLTQPYTVRVTG